MGLFNNSSGEETTETLVSVTIPVEVKQKTTDQSVFYYQVSNYQIQNKTDILKSDDKISAFSPDTGTLRFKDVNFNVHEFLFSGFRFSRPPPTGC